MIVSNTLPLELRSIIDNKKYDFVVEAKTKTNFIQKFLKFHFLFWWIAIMSFCLFFAYTFFKPLFFGETISFTLNGVETIAWTNNFKPLFMPIIGFVIFFILSIGILKISFWILSPKKNWFIGTPSNLIIWRKWKIKSIKREVLSSNIKVLGDNQKGTIVLGYQNKEREAFSKLSKKLPIAQSLLNTSQHSWYVIFLVDIPNVNQIATMCQKRIEEASTRRSK